MVIAFSNLDRNNVQSDTFKIPAGLAPLLGIKDGRTYNTRNTAAYTAQDETRDDVWLWGSGITGADLKSSGFFVSLNKVPTTAGAWTSAPFEGQYLKLFDVTPPAALGAPVPSLAMFGTVIGNQVTFTWSAASDPDGGVSGFHVQIGTTPGGSELLDAQTSTTTQTVSVAYGTTVYARVQQTNNAGIHGAYSSASAAVIALDPATDNDGDGQSNAAEQTASTNPLSNTSVLRATATVISGNSVTVTVATVIGKAYQLETSTTLAPQSWTSVGSPVAASGDFTNFVDPAGAGAAKRFYRAKVVP